MITGADVFELKQFVAALLAAILTLSGQSLWRRLGRARTAKALAVAFWEELSAVHFYGPEDKANVVGFSSQTFDAMFREMAESLPDTLARDLMRYHWRMKYLQDTKPHIGLDKGGGLNPQFWREAKELHARLRSRLEHLTTRATRTLLFRVRETCDAKLLTAGP